MKEFVKKYRHLIFVFLFTFVLYEFLIFYLSYDDAIPNYGFSYAIAKGQIPYKEFNIISTPLYAFIMAIGLKISNSYLMFIIEQSILVTIEFYFLFKMYGNKGYIVYLTKSLIFLGCGFFPTYNYMCFFCLVILLYLEKEHKDKDYLIGLFIGLSILSKHTVGVFFILPTIIFYYKDIKKILKRALGALIPGLIFVIYLLLTNSFNSFIDLCVLGLFDFSSSNSYIGFSWLIATLLILIVQVLIILKDKRNILNYYLLLCLTFEFFTFDGYHFSFYFISLVIMLLNYVNSDIKIIKYLILFDFFFLMVRFFIEMNTNGIVIATNMNHYNYTLRYKSEYEFYTKVNKEIINLQKEYDNVIIQMGYYQMIFDVSNDKEITYYDVLLTGNYGKNGSKKIIDRLKQEDNSIFVFSKNINYKNNNGQYDKDIIKYIKKYWKNITKQNDKLSKYGFEVYYKE